ncbi:MAG: tetratricopeptide repeat protein [Facklamia hominis]
MIPITDIINLPNNAQNYYRKGCLALQNNDFALAKKYLEESYQIENSWPCFHELIQLYLMTQNKQALKNLWQQVLKGKDWRSLEKNYLIAYAYSVRSLKSQSEILVQLYQIRDQLQSLGHDQQVLDSLIQQEQQKLELIDTLKNHRSSEDLNQWVQQLCQSPLKKVMSTVTDLYDLINTLEIDAVFTSMLQNDQLSNFIKSDILHFYLRQDRKDSLKLLWFNQAKTVDLKELIPCKQDPLFLDLSNRLDTYCQDNNPNLYDDLYNNLTLILLSFYPFLQQAIPDEPLWFEHFLAMNGVEESPDSPLSLEVQTYLELANREIQNLLLSLSF